MALSRRSTRTPDQGSGSATVIRRVVAAVLSHRADAHPHSVRHHGEAPPDPGSGASRVTHIVGRASVLAATRMKEQLEDLAAEVMGWPAGEVRLEGDEFKVLSSEPEPAAGRCRRASTCRSMRSRRALPGGAPVEVRGEYDSMAGGISRKTRTFTRASSR